MLYATFSLTLALASLAAGIGLHNLYSLTHKPKIDRTAMLYMLELLHIEETAERILAEPTEQGEAPLWSISFVRAQLLQIPIR